MAFQNRFKELLDVIKGQKIFKIINKNQHQHVLFGIFLFHRGRKQIILGVIVDHGFGENLIFRITLGIFQMVIHESIFYSIENQMTSGKRNCEKYFDGGGRV